MNADRVMVWVLLLFSTVGIVRCANVADADCTTGNEAACTAFEHAECVGDTPTCQCKQGYEDNSDPTVCTAIGLDGTCAADGDCTLVNHAVCTSTTCQCASGYIKNGNACDQVFGSSCTGDQVCPGLANSVCSGDTCGCAAGFVEKNNLCVKAVSETVCTEGGIECDSILNAECDEMKCQCKDGFVENADTCDEKSGAVSVRSAVGLMFGCMIVLLTRAL